MSKENTFNPVVYGKLPDMPEEMKKDIERIKETNRRVDSAFNSLFLLYDNTEYNKLKEEGIF